MSEDTPESKRLERRRRRRTALDAAPPADPGAWRALGVVAGVAAVLTLVGLVVPVPTGSEEQAGALEPVDSSIAICPEPGSSDGSRTTSAMAVIPDLVGQDRPGEASIGFLEGGDAADQEGVAAAQVQGGLVAPGDAAQLIAEESRLPALEVRALGGLAPGLVAAQTTQDSFTRGRGLSSQPCLAPDTTWWFVGGGSTAGRESELVLVNPEDSPADLEVAISGPDGPVSTPRLRGIVVEPRSRVVLRLSREAPRLPSAAWRVTVRQGRVMAALIDRETEGFIPLGADWIPASADPATRVLIPGVAGGPGGRQLIVHAPGDLSATVRVRLITQAGSFVPAATPEIEVPGGSVVAVPLEDALQGDDATVDLQSDVPIVASVRQRHVPDDAAPGSIEETSFAASAVSVDASAAVTGLPAERGTRVTVWMTAPDDIVVIERADAMTDGMSEDMPDEATGSPSDAMSMSASAPTAEPSPAPSGDDSAAVTVTLRILAVSPEGLPLPAAEDVTVSVPRGRLVRVDIPRPEGAAWFTAVATMSGGEVVIAHQSTRRAKDGLLVTGYPWRPLRTAVVVPRAVPDPRLAIPRS